MSSYFDWSVKGVDSRIDLLDLLNERHILLKNMMEEKWNEISDIPISYSEWYIMKRIGKEQRTIAHITKNVQITRQATHKLIKKLESKGIVEVKQANNNRDKCIQFTKLGEECFEKNIALKKVVEEKVAETIGEDQLKILKDVLMLDWGV